MGFITKSNMKTSRLSITVLCGALLLVFSGCTKSSDELTSSLIESNLVGVWSAPTLLAEDDCIAATSYATITFYSNHTFSYVHEGCVFSGSWNCSYFANRSGQDIKLTYTYTYFTNTYTDIFDLKYSSEADIFYSSDAEALELLPFIAK